MCCTKTLSFCCLILAFGLACCKKANPVPPPPVPPGDSTVVVPPKLHMSLSYLLRQSTITGGQRTNYELLVSESGGKILFDSVTDYNKTINADLQTGATLVDVSVIYRFNLSAGGQITVNTYKSVDLAHWKNVPLSDSVPGAVYPVVTGTATLRLTNIAVPPAFYWQFMSNTDPGPVASPEGISYSNDLTVTYPYEQDKYAYIAFPYNGLYKLHKIQGINDSVDLSRLDTAEKVSFIWPALYNINTLLYGYLDSTDLSKPLLLAPGHGDYTHNYSYETMYPRHKEFQKFDLALTGNPAQFDPSLILQAGVSWYNLDTIPVNIPFPDQSYFSVNHKSPDSFAVSFLKQKPTYYTFSSSFGTGGADNFLLTVPGDSTVLNPKKALMVSLQGKLLKGVGPAMFINGFTFIMDDDPTYKTFLNKQADVVLANKRPLSNQVRLAVGLGGLGGPQTENFLKLSSMAPRK